MEALYPSVVIFFAAAKFLPPLMWFVLDEAYQSRDTGTRHYQPALTHDKSKALPVLPKLRR